MKLLFFISSVLFFQTVKAQQVFLRISTPSKTQNAVTSSKQFLTGLTCKGCTLTVNGTETKVWSTGAFAVELNLKPGDTSFLLQSANDKGAQESKRIFFNYQLPEKEKSLTTNTVAYWRIEPQADLMLVKPGDKLKMTVKALPGAVVQLENGTSFKEIYVKDSNGVKGIYQMEYVVKDKDDLFADKPSKLKLMVWAKGTDDPIEATSKSNFAMMPANGLLLETKGKIPYLLLGLGEDRLGGTKMGYVDSLVRLKAVSKVGNKYCLQLSKNRQAYIEDEHVNVLEHNYTPSSLTGNMRVWGDSSFDYVSLSLTERLAYQTFQEVNPSKIIVDVFGATSNTNWITQLGNTKEIGDIYYNQIDEDIFRISIDLKNKQHWGHRIYYNGNNLVIRIKRQPQILSLNNLVIAIDAGHGGSNKGAFGLTGVMEKDMTLAIAKELQAALEAEGAKVVTTRTRDTTYDNHDRYTVFQQANPHLLISIHLNSSADPVRIKGVSTYYKHIGYRPLTKTILQRMLDMGLGEYGNIGNFNFILNGFTEFPNVLVETLFISNPEDEANLLDPAYRKQMADAIVKGINDWLELCKKQ
ncbi:N-acetylmuramoyl-L-alanine amidase [Lacibacter sediminis]|uniref:N-acetylmuramoyl-L-alanine amidase n=1 Tax=Lacibacter sediminis TaxID=2760713 RepID=A0A7G5XGW1_9BACT|nr:N-acetylmuramoyl-L-alanine amidase [Lacibacter sediminis]QNA44714.1 N-acetylmuramoyl-L-alanine amidase [Lacibacter sediminis]